MKFFHLTDTGFRESVNLKIYEDDIASAVAKVKPDAQLFVVENGFYTIPELGKRESILVSKELRQKSSLNRNVNLKILVFFFIFSKTGI